MRFQTVSRVILALIFVVLVYQNCAPAGGFVSNDFGTGANSFASSAPPGPRTAPTPIFQIPPSSGQPSSTTTTTMRPGTPNTTPTTTTTMRPSTTPTTTTTMRSTTPSPTPTTTTMPAGNPNPTPTTTTTTMRPTTTTTMPSGSTGGISGNVSFISGWSTDQYMGKWARKEAGVPSRMQTDTQTNTWHDRPSARLEINPADAPANAVYERLEVSGMKAGNGVPINENDSSGVQYIATSFKFPTDWQSPVLKATDWSTILELRGPDDLMGKPVFTIQANSVYQVSHHGGDVSAAGGGTVNFTDGGSLNLGKWTDLIIRIKFARTATGSITVYRRNEGQTNFTKVLDLQNIPTLQFKGTAATGDHYWKQGLYRNRTPGITNILWMGDTVRATTFSLAQKIAFGTEAPEP